MHIPTETSRAFATMSFVSSLLVVGIHSFSSDGGDTTVKTVSLVLSLVCSVAVPWFFFSAGFWIANHIGDPGWYIREVCKRLRSLLVPFWIWSVIYLCFYIVIAWMIHKCNYVYKGEDAYGLCTLDGFIRVFGFDWRATLPVMWFLRSLFILILFLPALLWMKWFVLPVSFILYLVWPNVGSSHYVLNNLFSHEGLLSLRGIAYFMLGIIVRQFMWRKGHGILLKCIFYISLIAVLIAVPIVILGGGVGREMVVAPLMYLIYLLSKRYPFPATLTNMAFPIYVIHLMPVLVITGVYGLVGIGGVGNIDFVEGVIRWVLSVMLSIVLCFCMRKFMPRISTIAFGGR